MNDNTDSFDNTSHKIVRRATLHELTVRQEKLLATDYPGPYGRKFLRQLKKDRPDLDITLVNKYSFIKDYPGDDISGIVTKIRGKDIFDVIQYHPAKVVDIDLFGGLSEYGMEAIESAPYWKKLFVTFTRNWRHRTLQGAMSRGDDPAAFVEAWAKRNGWKAIMTQRPYRRDNKRVIMGIEDERGPQYWTFLIERR